MTDAVRQFVNDYAAKSIPKMVISEFIKSHNHEIWRKCTKYGNFEDLRKTFTCTGCGKVLHQEKLGKNIHQKNI